MFLYLVLFLGVVAGAQDPPACPDMDPDLKSVHLEDVPYDNMSTKVTFINNAQQDMTVHWINYEGGGKVQGILAAGEGEPHNTFLGHAFRIVKYDGNVTYEHVVTKHNEVIDIHNCGNPDDFLWDEGRDKEFEELVLNRQCEGTSRHWSCVRHVGKEEVAQRSPEKFGFLDHETRGSRRKGQQRDDTCQSHP